MWLLSLLLMAQVPAQVPNTDRYLLWKSDRHVPAGPWAVMVVAPVFPDGLSTGEKGEVVALDVDVNPTGRVTRAVVSESVSPLAAKSALTALMQWRFEHGTSESRPVRVVITYRTMPVGTPPHQLTTIFRDKFQVEVRKVEGR